MGRPPSDRWPFLHRLPIHYQPRHENHPSSFLVLRLFLEEVEGGDRANKSKEWCNNGEEVWPLMLHFVGFVLYITHLDGVVITYVYWARDSWGLQLGFLLLV